MVEARLSDHTRAQSEHRERERGWRRNKREREGRRRTEELFLLCSFFSRTKERGNYGFLRAPRAHRPSLPRPD